MNPLEDTLATLQRFGLLDRTEAIKVGDITVTMGAAVPAPESQMAQSTSRAEEEAAIEEAMYGAARGHVPGVS